MRLSTKVAQAVNKHKLVVAPLPSILQRGIQHSIRRPAVLRTEKRHNRIQYRVRCRHRALQANALFSPMCTTACRPVILSSFGSCHYSVLRLRMYNKTLIYAEVHYYESK